MIKIIASRVLTAVYLTNVTKKVLVFLFAATTMFHSLGQVVYDGSAQKKKYEKESSELILNQSEKDTIRFSPEKIDVVSLLPTALGLGIDLLGQGLKKRKEKFTGEYNNQNLNLPGGKGVIPNIEFIRHLQFEGSEKEEIAIYLKLKAIKLQNIPGAYFEIDSFIVNYAKAKITTKNMTLDYAITLTPTLLVKGKRKTHELNPISIKSLSVGKLYKGKNHRTSIIPITGNDYFLEAKINIIETNPAKVKLEKMVSLYDKHKDDAKTIINNFFEPDEEDTN